MIGIDIKLFDQETETGRFKLKTNMMNTHFINELVKIGLQLINITGSLIGRPLYNQICDGYSQTWHSREHRFGCTSRSLHKR